MPLPEQMSQRNWVVETFAANVVPRSKHRENHAVMTCLNVAAWAQFCSQNKHNNQNYDGVFAYDTSREFMLKARHFIACTIYQYAKKKTKVIAKEFE